MLYTIRAEWDGEAGVWVASSDDVPGLATGADTFEELIEKLRVVVPELLDENSLLTSGNEEIPFAVFAERAGLPKAF
jgi:predicted RNase H-like HicB family nuclease